MLLATERTANLIDLSMVPADDGGQTYEMKCTICGEYGNILASRFRHADECPVEIDEPNMRR